MRTDTELQRDVTDELAWDPQIRNETIAIAVKDGVITLAGVVGTYAQKIAAETAVEHVKGVRAIVNELSVKLLDEHERRDPDIAQAALYALLWDTEVPNDRITVKVSSGVVTLEGMVDWFYQKMAAERAVRYLTGVKGLINHVAVHETITPSAVRQRIGDRLRRQAELDARDITVEVAGHRVTLRGAVHSLMEKRDVERAAYATPGVTTVENKLTVEPYLAITV